MAKRIVPAIFLTLWMALLAGLGIYYVAFAPREAEFTEKENRTLAAFPEITVESVFSGRFGQEIETYLLDRFPVRNQAIDGVNQFQSFVSLASHDEYLLIAENVDDPLVSDDYQAQLDALLAEIEQEKTAATTQPPATEPAQTEATEQPEETEPRENPPIEQKPEASLEDFPIMVGVYMDTGNGATMVQSYSRDNVLAFTRVLNKYAATLPENGKLMFTVGPPSYLVNRFVNAEVKTDFYSDWDDIINALGADNVYAFDTPDILCEHIQNGAYVAFRTDNHWTPYGAYNVYTQMAQRAGKEPASYTEDFTITVEEDFRGTYYRDNPAAYGKVQPDTLELLMPKIPVEYRKLTGPDTYEVMDFIKMDAVYNDRYTMYLGGPGGPWRYVECDNGQTENCLVVTDSFGLTVIPFLTSNYKQIHYYDARYFNQKITGGTVAQMIEKYEIQDIYVIVADFHSFGSTFVLGNVNYHLGLN